MAGEVTMKDLQSLQGYVNKKIAEVDKKVADVDKKIADLETKADALEKKFVSSLSKEVPRLEDLHHTQDERISQLRMDMNEALKKKV